MDGLIQMMPAFLKQYSTYIDFEGQHKAERIFQMILIVHGIVGFVLGYITQQLSMCMYCIFLGFIISCLLVLPPWPMYRRHPLNWQPNIDHESEEVAPKPVPVTTSKSENKKRR